MSNVYTYERIIKQAKYVKAAVEKEYKIAGTRKWAYYFAKAILNPHKDVKKIEFELPKKFEGDYISRGIYKSSYKDMAERVVKFIESNKKMPAYVKHTIQSGKTYNLECDMYVYMFAKILAEDFPQPVNLTSKAFIKPTENKNTVFQKWVNTFKFTPQYIDDVCDYILKHFTYQFYFDDHKSNAEVISSKAGNCTDLLQMLINMAKALGYEWKVIHTQCKQSGTGHVYGMFRKKGVNGGNWFIRDIACIADESRYCVWCEVPSGGNKLAENPSWFLANLNR